MHIREKTLVLKHSPFNLILLTEDAEGLRTLRFSLDDVCQSVVKVDDAEYLALPYTRILPMCLAFGKEPTRILVLGLGGGTLPRFFHKILPDVTVDVAEIDPEVAAIARDYCGFTEDARLQVYVEDGRDFIEARQGLYDFIILDSFGAEAIPAHLLTSEFLQGVQCALTKGGIAVANVWGRNRNHLYEHMLLTYRKVFTEVYVLDVPGPGSKIFVALTQKLELSRETLLEKMRLIPMRHGFHTEEITFRHSDQERLQNGHVLQD